METTTESFFPNHRNFFQKIFQVKNYWPVEEKKVRRGEHMADFTDYCSQSFFQVVFSLLRMTLLVQ